MDEQFDEAMVERLAKALFEVLPAPALLDNETWSWETHPLEVKALYWADARAVLTALSQEYAIVAKTEYAELYDTIRDVRCDLIERICAKCDHNCSGCEEVYPYRVRLEEILAKEASPNVR